MRRNGLCLAAILALGGCVGVPTGYPPPQPGQYAAPLPQTPAPQASSQQQPQPAPPQYPQPEAAQAGYAPPAGYQVQPVPYAVAPAYPAYPVYAAPEIGPYPYGYAYDDGAQVAIIDEPGLGWGYYDHVHRFHGAPPPRGFGDRGFGGGPGGFDRAGPAGPGGPGGPPLAGRPPDPGPHGRAAQAANLGRSLANVGRPAGGCGPGQRC